MNSHKQIIENGHYFVYGLIFKVLDKLFMVDHNFTSIQEQDSTIVMNAFLRNCLSLHIVFVIISINVFLFEKIL